MHPPPQSRKVPIPSIQPNLGCDYVFYMQAERIKKMRLKRKGEDLIRRSMPMYGYVPKRRKIPSRQKVAKKRVRDVNGKFVGSTKPAAAEEQKDTTMGADDLAYPPKAGQE